MRVTAIHCKFGKKRSVGYVCVFFGGAGGTVYYLIHPIALPELVRGHSRRAHVHLQHSPFSRIKAGNSQICWNLWNIWSCMVWAHKLRYVIKYRCLCYPVVSIYSSHKSTSTGKWSMYLRPIFVNKQQETVRPMCMSLARLIKVNQYQLTW